MFQTDRVIKDKKWTLRSDLSIGGGGGMLRWGRLDSTQPHGKWKWNTFSKQDPLSYQLYCLISATWRRCVAYRHEWTKGRRAVVLLLSYLELLLADRYVGTSSFRFTLVFIDFTLSYPFASIYPAIRFPSHVYRILTCLLYRLYVWTFIHPFSLFFHSPTWLFFYLI